MNPRYAMGDREARPRAPLWGERGWLLIVKPFQIFLPKPQDPLRVGFSLPTYPHFWRDLVIGPTGRELGAST